jgi:hypothetical protein
MRLVASSDPSAVSRFEARELLLQRAVLTRMVCRELIEKPEAKRCLSSRADAALGFLMGWIYSQPRCPSDPSPSYGIDSMVVPDGCSELLEEIRDGSAACDALTGLRSADNDSEWDSDMSRIEGALEIYWNKHSSPTIPERKGF